MGDEALLVEAAGRLGTVGRKMTILLEESTGNMDYEVYCDACKRAIDINDPQKVLFLLEQVPVCVSELEPSFYGEMARYAYSDHRFIAKEIIRQCSDEQIAAAPSRLLAQFAGDHDYRTLSELVEKGISGGSSSATALYMLTYQRGNRWMAEELLKKRMWVDIQDYSALHACVQNDAVEVCKLLLERGMDFEQYRQWAEARHCSGHEETTQELSDYWSELKAGSPPAPPSGPPCLGR